MNSPDAEPRQEQKIFQTLKSDFQRGDFFDSIRREMRDTHEYLLDEDRRKRLSGMNPLKRWMLTAWWMLKGMFFRLTPARRLLFTLGFVLLFLGRSDYQAADGVHITLHANLFGVMLIILVLMLELKDKLVAKEELEAGRFVQEALKPDRSPEFAGWDIWLFTRSANEVGGDLVDFVRLGEDRAAVVLGDVAGKGLRAALLMAKLQATVRALADEAPTLSTLAIRVNRIFFRDSLRNIFASMVCFRLERESAVVRLVNAGHFPPVVARAGGVETLPKGGAALGLTPAAEYHEQEISLAPGELLCAYSDGVSEAQNVSGDFFGEPRIREILSRNAGRTADAAGVEIVNTVDRFVGEAKRRDDLTLVIIGRRP